MFYHPCIPGINPTCSLYMVLLIPFCVQFANILLKILASRGFGQDGGAGRNPSLPHTTKRFLTQSKINKLPEAPENQTACNSNSQEIKEKVNQNNQTSKNPWRQQGWLRKTAARWWIMQVGLAEGETETQSLL